ncbi:Stf0 family sulfotransferase [Paraburkholderia sp. J7]|uniref:Stf0 family sulfotransferase n=1 Tax=Paraburkholderia sp. J7 TaxID=2805438 RepID=UPI002AB7A33C|nr:Stf0 family sulfotransferase [Paraburkholderia sp. J7]
MTSKYPGGLPCGSTALRTQYGEQVGDYFFAPLRKYKFTEDGVKRWYAPHLASRPQDGRGFSAINVGDAVSVHEQVPIPPNHALLVAHAYETMAMRTYIASPGLYFVMGSFVPALFEGGYVVSVCANGTRLWESEVADSASVRQYAAFLRFDTAGFVDFAINVEKAQQTAPSRAFILHAIVMCDAATGRLQLRLDDRVSGPSEREIVDQYAATPFQPVAVAGPSRSIEERAVLFENEWTLPREYIESQLQRSPRELVELVMKNEGPASTKYCIFMIPRSGSTLLTELLASTGQLGFPGEHFVPDVLRTYSLAFSDVFVRYEDFLASRLRSENGVFGIEIESERFLEEPDFFSDVDEWRHVYIWRKDVLAQAISYQISIETGVWHNFSGSRQDEAFLYIPRHAIIDKVNFMLRAERFFEAMFEARHLSPYRIAYEDLVADPIGHGRHIAEHIGLDGAGLSFANQGGTVLQPTAKGRNAYYRSLAITAEGQLWGYNIHEVDGQYAAALSGVELSLLDMKAERAPVLFISQDREALCDRVGRFVMHHMATLQPV